MSSAPIHRLGSLRPVHALAVAAALSLAACSDGTDDDATPDTLGPMDVPAATEPGEGAGVPAPGPRPPGESQAGAGAEGQDGLDVQGGLPNDDGVIERGENEE
jgi:hypothetical protein